MVTAAAILGPSAVVAVLGSTTIKALARNPSSGPVIMIGMVTMLIFNQCLIIISLLVFFQLFKQY
jgi:F0F1-type ATP synthase membrane subunit c/vacuolar-type H+-ATPase subunit K